MTWRILKRPADESDGQGTVCDGERLGRVVQFEEFADLAIAELMKVCFRRFENLAGFFVLERTTAEGDNAVALSDIFVHTIVDHFPFVW